MQGVTQGKGKLTRRELLKDGLGSGLAFTVLGLSACQQPTPTPTAAPAKPTEAPKAAAAPTAASAASPTAAPAKPTAAAAKPTAPAAQPAAKTGVVSVSFSTQGTPKELEMFEVIVKSFEEANKNIRVERKFDPSLSWEKVHTMLGAGTAASVQRANDDDIFVLRGLRVIRSLDDYVKADVKRDDYYPMTWTSRVGAGDEVAAINAGSSPTLMFYNVDHFKEAGLTPAKTWKEAWTLDQMNDALKKLTKKTSAGKTERYAYANETRAISFYMDNWGAQRYNADETECALNQTPAALEACTWYQDIYVKHGYGYWLPQGEPAAQSFNSGLVSIAIQQSSFARNVKSDLKYDVMPMFLGKANKNLTENSNRCFVIPAGEKAPDAAWKLGLYVWAEPGRMTFAKYDFAVPMLKKAAESKEFVDPKLLPANRAIFGDGVANDVHTPSNPISDDYMKWFSRTVNELTSGQKTPKAFLDERVQRINEALKQSGWNKGRDWNRSWTFQKKT